MSKIKEIQFFPERELKCQCGKCQYPGMDENFLNILFNVRAEVDSPLILSSAYRCPEHNTSVSRTGATGPHTTGKAVDILCSGELAYEILRCAADEGMTGIGIKQTGAHGRRFIHLDALEDDETKGPRPWVWSY